jgi:hypothetical protein
MLTFYSQSHSLMVSEVVVIESQQTTGRKTSDISIAGVSHRNIPTLKQLALLTLLIFQIHQYYMQSMLNHL